MSTRFRFIVFVLLLALTACVSGRAQSQNRQKWESQKISHYSFEVSIGCFCAWRDLMPLKAEVKDGQIISLTDKSGQPIPANFAEDFNKAATAEGLFGILDSVQGKAQEVRVEYEIRMVIPNPFLSITPKMPPMMRWNIRSRISKC